MKSRANVISGIPKLFVAVVIVSLALTGCGSEPQPAETQKEPAAPPQQTEATAPANQKRYDLTGTVTAVDKSEKVATVDHADIPGFMAAMTMGYTVKDDQALEKLSSGDRITAKVVVGDGGEYWLENVVVTGKATPAK